MTPGGQLLNRTKIFFFLPISYAEKVQSYLTDQKTTGHPFDGSDQVQNQSAVEEPMIKKHSKQEQSRKPSEQEQNR